jgi:hypothetical protein
MAFEQPVWKRSGMVIMTVALGLTGLSLEGCKSMRGNAQPGVMQTQEQGGGFNPFGRRGARTGGATANDGTAIGVNSFLWRASLDVVSFMPLASADPFGGLIITDWYTNPEKPDERFKVNVYILDTRLRADGINVSIVRQVKSGADWIGAPTSPQTEEQMENAILSKARALRIGSR